MYTNSLNEVEISGFVGLANLGCLLAAVVVMGATLLYKACSSN